MSNAWVVSPVAAVASIAASRYLKSWTPFKVGIVVGTFGDMARGYWQCASYREALGVLDGRIVDAKTRLGEARAASRGGAPAQ